MQVSQFRLNVDRQVIAPKTSTAGSLAEAKQSDAERKDYEELRNAMETVVYRLEDLKAMDGSQQAVSPWTSQPPHPSQPTGWQKVFNWNAQAEYEGKKIESQTYEIGGRDRAPAAGHVITTREDNRFGVDAEIKFTPSQESRWRRTNDARRGHIPSGVESASASWELPDAEARRICEAGYGGLVYPHRLSVTKSGDVETYELVQTTYKNPTATSAPGTIAPLVKEKDELIRLQINRVGGTLTFERGTIE